jgi:hypothetical protein
MSDNLLDVDSSVTIETSPIRTNNFLLIWPKVDPLPVPSATSAYLSAKIKVHLRYYQREEDVFVEYDEEGNVVEIVSDGIWPILTPHRKPVKRGVTRGRGGISKIVDEPSDHNFELSGFVVEKHITIAISRGKTIANLRREIESVTDVTSDRSLLFIEEDRSVTPLPLPSSLRDPITSYFYTTAGVPNVSDFRKSILHTSALKGSYLADPAVVSLLSPEDVTLADLTSEEDIFLSLERASSAFTLESLTSELSVMNNADTCDVIASQLKVPPPRSERFSISFLLCCDSCLFFFQLATRSSLGSHAASRRKDGISIYVIDRTNFKDIVVDDKTPKLIVPPNATPSDLKKIILGTLPVLRTSFKSGSHINFPDLDTFTVSLRRGSDSQLMEGSHALTHWSVRDSDWVLLDKRSDASGSDNGVTLSLQFVLAIDQVPPYPLLSIQLKEVLSCCLQDEDEQKEREVNGERERERG